MIEYMLANGATTIALVVALIHAVTRLASLERRIARANDDGWRKAMRIQMDWNNSMEAENDRVLHRFGRLDEKVQQIEMMRGGPYR